MNIIYIDVNSVLLCKQDLIQSICVLFTPQYFNFSTNVLRFTQLKTLARSQKIPATCDILFQA